MQLKDIVIRGAREHNLKNITVTIPRNTLTVICGLSGSGKSSLAFDTLYSEGQRRYVESLSAYARQFLGLMEKPDVDSIEGLSPAIAIEQKSAGHNPRSTVGTVTEIHDYLRVIFARVGTPYCYKCGRPITRQTVQEIADQVMELPQGTKFRVLAPVVSGRKGEYHDLFDKLQKDGFLRVRVDGTVHTLDEDIALEKSKKHSIDVVIDRLVAGKTARQRLTDSLETALKLSEHGTVRIDCIGGDELVFSELLSCTKCGISLGELSPRMFSFNSPFGACPDCNGLGYLMELDPELVAPDPSRSLAEGAVTAWNAASAMGSWNRQIMLSVCRHFKIPIDKPYGSLSARHKKILLYGSGTERISMEWRSQSGEGRGRFKRPFEGVIPSLLRRYKETSSEDIRRWIEGFMGQKSCPACGGARLRKESLSVLLADKSIADLSSMAISDVKAFFAGLTLKKRQHEIARQIIKETHQRLDFLVNVGLPYLSLDRVSSSLSGGEAQRIRLATQIGSQLTGVTYILDEPSIGLHASDNGKLLGTLVSLRDLGNTVVVIEHDRETLETADHLIDIGPGAGVRGGRIVATGTPAGIAKNPDSLTGRYLAGKRSIPVPAGRRPGSGASLTVAGARGHNLKNVRVDFPLGKLICVTGVSGSGKSTLVNQTLYPALARKIYSSKAPILPCTGITGAGNIDKVINVDQSPIGRTPRSNPVTYTKTFDAIRDLFAMLPESKIRGYPKGRFSFNVKGGRCETCEGDGVLRIEMHFLPDVYVECESCHGRRYNRETLEITFKGKNIADVLAMTVDEALVFFDRIPAIKSKLAVLSRVGLGYVHLGQQATTLSGGEAQRIKLSTELAKRATGQTLYILDEPTTGLHFEDILMLMDVLQELVDKGNTVIIIEHNLDVIKCADHIIDLGPEGGDKGGRIVAQGTPEQVAKNKNSLTGKYLKSYLG
ncbi:MAG: excinuclease ABC subunit UvrA [Chitinivibrionales bacterium]|nr:excinuclease ABC subunit UvrA [Chitinivibrionales bacterium]MBD3395010.1 excinuclease ABC subunit UvrA [Chitinivibrionales bacterium]